MEMDTSLVSKYQKGKCKNDFNTNVMGHKEFIFQVQVASETVLNSTYFLLLSVLPLQLQRCLPSLCLPLVDFHNLIM